MSNTRSFLNVSKPFESWGRKAEAMIEQTYPGALDSGVYDTVHVGRNRDGGVGDRGGYRVRGNAQTMAAANYVSVPDRMIGDDMLASEETKRRTFTTRASDAIRVAARERVNELVDKGATLEEAQKRVNDAIKSVGYFDSKTNQFVAERIMPRVNDSVLSGLTTPRWDIAEIQRIFKQPLLRGYADGLVNKLGIPNVWADLVQIYTETFDMSGVRVSNAAKTMGTMNTSIGHANRTGTMLSEIINLVIDYESPSVQEEAISGMPGNWLSNAAGVGERDARANFMLEQFMNTLIYFGHDETGFEGLTQIATRDGTNTQYADKPALELWNEESDGTNATVGADILVKLSHFIADKMEELYFLPTICQVRCSPLLYKVLKFSQLSKVYNQNNPLSAINTAYESGNKLVGTLATASGDGLWRSFEIVPDPMLMPNTPFNNNPWDLMFMTFPYLQNAAGEPLTDMIMMPQPIDCMVLPSAPGYRDGVVRTCLKRIGSLLVPVEKVVHIIEGIGTNNWWTP